MINLPWRALFWFGLILLAAMALWRLSDILLPFVAGATMAYLLNPLAHQMAQWKVPRGITAVVLILGFFALIALILVLVVPLVQDQVSTLIRRLPEWTTALRGRLDVWLEQFNKEYGLSVLGLPELGLPNADQARQALTWVIGVVTQVLTGGLALVNLLSLLFITPVVAFYLLRDWDALVARLDSYLPRQSAAVIRMQIREIDRTLAGYIRGQATLCLVLAVYYAAGLGLVGLEFGLMVGVLTGTLSFVPYVGALIGGVTALGLALLQFDNWTPIILVAVVFFSGQIAEGYLLQPILVGDRVGLHPVWVIFALLAGGSLFGFLGLLLAIPVAAVIGVLLRFGIQRYLESPLYDPTRPG
jgi:predicted PurR-regulated permease PerM